MVSCIAVVALLVVAAVGLTLWTGRTLDATLPLVMVGYIAVLFLGYLLGIFHAATWLVVLAPVLAGLAAWRRRTVARGRLRRVVPQLVVLAGVVPLLAAMTARTRVLLWDELRLWGAYPKVLHETSAALQLSADSQLIPIMRGYLPGMPLFQAGLQVLSPGFSESAIFFGYAIFCSILLMPLLRGASLARPVTLVGLGVLLAFLPAYFGMSQNDLGDYFRALYIEPAVGVVAGYCCYRLATGAHRSWLGMLDLGLAVAVGYLLKDAALSLVVAALVPATVLVLRRVPRTEWPRRLAALWLPIGLVMLAWRIAVTLHPQPSVFKVDYLHAKGYRSLLPSTWDHLVHTQIRTGTRALFPELTSFTAFAAALVVVALALLLLTPRRLWSLRALGFAAVTVFTVAHIAGIHILTVAAFGGEYLSFPRYMEPPLTAGLCMLVMLLPGIARPRRTRGGLIVSFVLALALAFLALQAPLREPRAIPYHDAAWQAYTQKFSDDILADVRAVEPGGTADRPTRVFVLYQGPYEASVGISHRIYFNLVGTGVMADGILETMDVVRAAPKPDGSGPTAEQRLAKSVREGNFAYVYVAQVDDEVRKELGTVFTKPPVAGTLYRPTFSGDRIVLTPVA